MRFMLDTDICIYIIKRKPEAVLNQLRKTVPEDVCISAVTMAELLFGVAKSERSEQNAAALEAFLLPISVAPFDEAAAHAYGTVRANLEKLGRPIGALDTMIASHALSIHADLVTNNSREFSRVSGLRIVDWTA